MHLFYLFFILKNALRVFPSQLNHSRSSVKGTAELLVGMSGLTFEAEILSTNSGFKQVLVFNHSVPQVV